MDRLKDVVNQQYQTKKVQFALASKGMADQITSDNKRRINGAQIDPNTVLRPMDVVNTDKQNTQTNQKSGSQSNTPFQVGQVYNGHKILKVTPMQ